MSWLHWLLIGIGFVAGVLCMLLWDALRTPEVSNRIHDDEAQG